MAPPSRNVLATTATSADALHCALSLLQIIPAVRVRKKTLYLVMIKVRFEAISEEERGAI